MPRTAKRGRWRLSLVVITATLACGSALFFARSLFFPGLVDQGIATYTRGDLDCRRGHGPSPLENGARR